MSSRRQRNQPWKKESRDFYARRDAEARSRTEVDLDAARDFILGCRQPTGYLQFPPRSAHHRRREPDLENTFGAVCAGLILGVPLEDLLPRLTIALDTDRRVLRLGRRDEPLEPEKVFRYLYVKSLERRVPPRVRRFLKGLLMERRDGRTLAFGGATSEQKPLQRTWEAIVTLGLLGGEEEAKESLDFIQDCFDQQEGGFAFKPGGRPDVTATYNGIALCQMVGVPCTGAQRDALVRWLSSFEAEDGYRTDPRHHPNLWKNSDIILSLAMLDALPERALRESFCSYLARCQAPDGGFRPSIHGRNSSGLRTYSALGALSVLGFPGLVPIDPVTGFPKVGTAANP
jgi:hypothetical protein